MMYAIDITQIHPSSSPTLIGSQSSHMNLHEAMSPYLLMRVIDVMQQMLDLGRHSTNSMSH